MHKESIEFFFKVDTELLCLALCRRQRNDDIAKQSPVRHGKGKDVGRFVLAAKITIQSMDLFVVGK